MFYQGIVLSTQPDSNGWRKAPAALRKAVETFPAEGYPLRWSFLEEKNEAGRVLGLGLSADGDTVTALVHSDFFSLSGRFAAASFIMPALPALGAVIEKFELAGFSLTEWPSDPAATPLVQMERAVQINVQARWRLAAGVSWEIRDWESQVVLEHVLLARNGEDQLELRAVPNPMTAVTTGVLTFPLIGIRSLDWTDREFAVFDRAMRQLVHQRGYWLVGVIPPEKQ